MFDGHQRDAYPWSPAVSGRATDDMSSINRLPAQPFSGDPGTHDSQSPIVAGSRAKVLLRPIIRMPGSKFSGHDYPVSQTNDAAGKETLYV